MMSSVLEWGERKGEERGKKGEENRGNNDNRGRKIWKEKREEKKKSTKNKV